MLAGKRPALVAVAALGLALGSCHPPEPVRAPVSPPSPAGKPLRGWATRTLASLTLEEKVGQMIGVRASGIFSNPRSAGWRRTLDEVRTLGVGTVVVFESEVGWLPRALNKLQAAAKVPLLISADMERGLAFRVRRGVAPLPYAMAIGATGSEDAAYAAGEITAREGRALGIHWAFAPVADVNNNPDNPVINIRSFGEDPELVARLGAAFVRGARAGGILTTAKHFPGHGDTAVDSHLQLATIAGDRARLQGVELLPFRSAIDAGVDSVMIGHIAVPSLDPTGAPATLSQPLVDALLRREMGFQGLIVTDAMEMSGVRAAWTGEAAVRAVLAGADFILLPPDPEVAIQALVRAVREGQLTEARIDASVLRILESKERLGLDRDRMVDEKAYEELVGRPEDVARAEAMAVRSITVVRNEDGILPLRAEEPLRLLHLVLASDARNDAIQGIPESELAQRRLMSRTFVLGPEVSAETEERILAEAPAFTHVLVSAFVRVTSSKGTADMIGSHARLLSRLGAIGKPLVVVSYGSPYLLRQFPDVPAYVCAYGGAESSQRAAMEVLFGEAPATGRLPVTIPGSYPRGHGLQIPRHDMTLRAARPEDVGFRPQGLAEVDRVIDDFLARKAFPGGVLAVGKDGALVHLRAFGRLSYDTDAPATAPDTIYDLASLTKVVVTTTLTMTLVEEGRLDLAKPVRDFLPAFSGGDKDQVTVWHLLTHSSGVDWWAPLYQQASTKAEYLKAIYAKDLVYPPGSKSVYSDLGIMLLWEVLERVSGEPLETLARKRLFTPLGWKDTGYRPAASLLPRIAPTEKDPWRGRVVRGEVHDENAAGLGGIAAHAGLFGTAPELARFAQMLLWGGVYDHHRFVSRELLERFTRRADVPDSTRALGWDTPSETGSSAGSLFSRSSFGHTGFTGTSMWMDPERKLFVILLTNRVHPTRENNLIREARPAVADAVVRALAQP